MIFKSSTTEPISETTSDESTSPTSTSHESLVLSQPNLLGEIFICHPQAVLLAAEKNKRVDDMMTFLLHHAIDNLLLGKEGTYYDPLADRTEIEK
jgi:ssRNA-specific RNase YbeY (16S rRNA maturation enzyme)